ncbi:MAG: alpha/beta hydrolase family protein, partial [Bacteroidaceae bacterium]|nr:alpha/beta hydrolase family protein [Paraprevotella sp.]MDY2716806.1 alpha/beta hydrolase family protein [Bacteroidaceae bacterium]
MKYNTFPFMSKLFLEKGRTMKMDTSSKDAFLSWQIGARKKLRELLALDSIPSITPSPILIESIEVEEGIIREKWVLETAPDLFMPFYVLIPSTENENTPVYITAPGHLGG